MRNLSQQYYLIIMNYELIIMSAHAMIIMNFECI